MNQLCSLGVASLYMLCMAVPETVMAQQKWTGAVSSDFTVAGNWDPGCGGGACSPTLIDISVPAIIGSTSVVNNQNNSFVVGNTAGGSLTINGGTLIGGVQFRIGGNQNAFGVDAGTSSGSGSVTVTNGGKLNSATTATGNTFRVGDLGTGVLTLSNGGILNLGVGADGGNGTGRVAVAWGAGSTGTINIGAAVGEGLQAAGILNGGSVIFGAGNGRVVFNHTNTDYQFKAALRSNTVGAGALEFRSGTTILTTNSNEGSPASQHRAFSGIATVYSGGTMGFGNNLIFGGGTQVIVQDGGRLYLGSGTATPRSRIAVTIDGDLLFSSGSIIEMGLGLPGADLGSHVGSVGDLINVTGTLKLDGTLNIYDIGDGDGGQGFNFGRYELFTYGSLDADSNLNIVGSLPNGIPGTLSNDGANSRIILVVEQALGDTAWWAGGDGTWNNDPDAESWSAVDNPGPGDTLFAWNEGQAIFNGAGGAVTVTDDVNFTEISFETNGYVIADGGGGVIGKPVDNDASIVNLGVMSGITGEIATGLKEARSGLQMRKYNTGTLILSNSDNAWTGGTIIEQGTLQIGNGGTTGHLPGNVTNGGILAFNRSNINPYDGVISGNGQVRQIGTGTTILTGASTYTGLTTISAGTLQIGNAGDGQNTGSIGTGAVSIGANGTLAFDRSGDLTFGNTIAGAGTLAQRGGGELLLTGILTNFTGKLLAEHGSIRFGSASNYTGTVTVGDGGVFSGTGRVGGITVQSGGTLSPGDSIGTLNVNGTLEFQTGSTFAVEVDDTVESLVAPIVQSADRVVVTGNVKLGGTVRVDADEARTILNVSGREWNQPVNRYTILTYTGTRTHDGVDTAFDTEVDTDLLFMTPTLDYGNGTVTLTLVRNDIRFSDIGLTPNQIAAGAALESLGYGHPVTAAGVPLHDAALTLNGDAARAAFDAVSGEVHASIVGMLLDDSRLLRDAVMDRAYLNAGRELGTQVWMRALGHDGTAEGDGVSEFKRDALGVIIGADHELAGGNASFGWAIGHHTNASAKTDALLSESEANNTHLAVYGGTRQDSGLGVRLGASYTWHEMDVERTVVFSGLPDESVKTDYKGNTLQTFGEVDWRMNLGDGLEVAPFIGLAWARLETDSFMEADFLSPIGSTAALGAAAQKHDASFATLGARGSLAMSSMLQVQGMLGYRRTLSGDDPSVRLGFLDGGQRFDVVGAPLSRDAMVADVGLSLVLGEALTLGAAYNGQIGKDRSDHAIQARLIWALE